MDVRFRLDEKLDADLIARIKEKANGSGHNLAARFLMRHWYEIEISGFSTLGRQQSNAGASDTGDASEPDFNSLDAKWE